MIERFATLLLGHLIADFPLQANWVYRLKQRGWAGVLLHVGIHVGVTVILLRVPWAYGPPLLILAGIHFLADQTKPRIQFRSEALGFLLDQLLHVLSLFFLAQWPGENLIVLPEIVLYLAVLYALVPVVFMLLAVRAGDRRPVAPAPSPTTSRPASQDRLIRLSQLAGFPLVVGLLILTLVRLASLLR